MSKKTPSEIDVSYLPLKEKRLEEDFSYGNSEKFLDFIGKT
jgi:hypothetical protein